MLPIAAMSKIPLILNLFFDFRDIDKPIYLWWQAGFKLQGNVASISPYQVDCEVPTIIQQPSITPNNANEGTNSSIK